MNMILDMLAILAILAIPFLLGGIVFVPVKLLWDCWLRRRERKLATEEKARHKAYTRDMFRQIRDFG